MISIRKIGARWQPVDSSGHVVRGNVYNADGRGYSTKEGAREAAEMLRQSLAWTSASARKSTAPSAKDKASAGFAIHTDAQGVIEDNARERFGPAYGDAGDRAKMMKAGLVDDKGKITDRGWKQLNEDIRHLEDNALGWLRKTFGQARDEGHDSSGDLIGSLSFDPRSVKQARNIYMGAREGRQERVDFSDAGYGDFARSPGAWKGVSNFGQDVLGGHITFFDIQPTGAIEIAEETADRGARRR